MKFLVLFFLIPLAHAQGLKAFSGVMGAMGFLPPQKKILNYSGAFAPENDPTTIQQHRFNILTPMGESSALSLNTGHLRFNEPVPWKGLPGRTPKSLTRLELGGQYTKELPADRKLGLRATVGSASDHVFATSEEVTFSVNGSYSYPSGEKAYWIWTAFMSNNNPFLNYIPIPGFLYLTRTETFTGMFGLPFLSMQWKPAPPLQFSFSFFITNLTTEITYSLKDSLQLFTGFSTSRQTFLREDRSHYRDRIFFNEKKIYAGFKMPLSGALNADVQLGQSFDRELREGKRFSDRDATADLKRSWYQSLNLTYLF